MITPRPTHAPNRKRPRVIAIPTRFWKSVAVIMAGAGLAQVILMAATPILSRLFDPIQFGILTAFLVVPNALLPAIGGKFEVAMVLPRSDRTARLLLGFAIQICLLTSVLLLLWTLSPLDSGTRYAIYEPLYLFLAGNVLILQYTLNRNDQFARLGYIRIVIATATISTMLLAGWLGAGTGGLVGGSLVGQAIGLALLLWWGVRPRGLTPLTSRSAKATLRRYREYPALNASSGLISGITLAIPVLVIERVVQRRRPRPVRHDAPGDRRACDAGHGRDRASKPSSGFKTLTWKLVRRFGTSS